MVSFRVSLDDVGARHGCSRIEYETRGDAPRRQEPRLLHSSADPAAHVLWHDNGRLRGCDVYSSVFKILSSVNSFLN
jgi:hypothetical protein